MRRKLKVWCLLFDQFAHVTPVERAFNGEAEFIYDQVLDPESMLKARPDLVLCVNDYPVDVARGLDIARENQIPSLMLQDGILEWRCQYENPLFGAGGGAPQHQPVLADKIACIGHQSFRQIAAWGNAAKVELTGMPRLDGLCSSHSSPRSPGSRILVMTAKNPGFTPAQRDITMRSMMDLKQFLDSWPPIETLWRVSKGIAVELGVENQLHEVSSADLATVVRKADAVITTPSTAMLEAMLLGRPVAALDYHNVPRFVQTAWTISAAEHIPDIVAELLNPPATKLAFQQDALADNLVCDGRAAARVQTLIERLVAHRKSNKACLPPADLLGEKNCYRFFQPVNASLLYKDHAVFQEQDVEQLQVRLARAHNENARLKTENAELRKRIQLGSWIKKGVRQLTQLTRLH